MSVSERFLARAPQQEDIDLFVSELESNGRTLIGKPEVIENPYKQKGRWLIAVRHKATPDPKRVWVK